MVNIAKTRLYSQHIGANLCGTPQDVVRSLGAVQSQDYAHSLWAIGIRTKNATVSDVEQALTDGLLVRTWLMRGTVHLILAEDLTWMRTLLSERILSRLTPKAWEYHAMTPEVMERARIILVNALSGKKALSRRELVRDHLAAGGIFDDKQQSYFIFDYLSHTGVLCSGPPQGKDQTFVLADEWTTNQRQLSRDESLCVLAERFFTSHGPATLADYVNWSGLKVVDAKFGLQAVRSSLKSVTIDGQEYFMSPQAKESEGLFLLPGYDEFLIGYKDRSASFKTYGHTPISTYNGMFYATIIEDGQVLGVWRRTIKPKIIDAELHPIVKLSKFQLARIQEQIEAYSAFLGKPVQLKVKGKLEIAEKGEWSKNKNNS
ncbi:MAG TPA: winged helix DNA-binding domain-containing protein [Candidatus Saccharimonadales bacterium]|nr:winged helix DNA-binding domain-containing protein [Candidatus Saccharimonadales bacterium]